MKSNLNISAYGEGILYPPNLEANMSAIQNAGWTSLMVSLFQVSQTGDISVNGINLISNGQYIGDPAWPEQLAELKSNGSIKTLLATFGGWDSAFQNIQDIYDVKDTFEGTQLAINAKVFRATFPAFDIIDMDVEYPDGPPTNAQAAFIAFCKMWIDVNFDITFCPYGDIQFWTGSLVALEKLHPGSVKYWNLQCYAGGQGNNPQVWADAIKAVLPNFDVDGYIIASDWTRFWDSTNNCWNGDCPDSVTSLLAPFTEQSCVGGGFIWTIDQILSYSSEEKIHPDPHNCGSVNMQSYVNAIKKAFKN